MLPTKFRYIWPNGFRGEEFLTSANQKKELPVLAMFVMDRDGLSNLYRGPPIYASYQVSVHLANQKQASPVAAMFGNRSGRNEQFL